MCSWGIQYVYGASNVFMGRLMCSWGIQCVFMGHPMCVHGASNVCSWGIQCAHGASNVCSWGIQCVHGASNVFMGRPMAKAKCVHVQLQIVRRVQRVTREDKGKCSMGKVILSGITRGNA
jgi:hypothetical protein